MAVVGVGGWVPDIPRKLAVVGVGGWVPDIPRKKLRAGFRARPQGASAKLDQDPEWVRPKIRINKHKKIGSTEKNENKKKIAKFGIRNKKTVRAIRNTHTIRPPSEGFYGLKVKCNRLKCFI